MKNFINSLLFSGLIVLALSLGACDQINPPYTQTNNNPDTSHTDSVVRKVLLEDYTGFKCVHCPTAADLAHGLDTIYKGRLVLMSVHAGFYSIPDPTHTYDFRTTVGTELDNFFGNSTQGNPNGLVSRFGYPTNVVLKSGKWESTIQNLIAVPAKLSIKLAPSYDASTKKVSVKVDLKYLQNSTQYDNLCVYIIEDSIIQYQADVRYTPPDRWDYVHMHVLRGSFNGTWGDQLSTTDIASGTTFSKTYSMTIDDSKWVPKNLKVIAFVEDFSRSYEVWQVEDAKVIP